MTGLKVDLIDFLDEQLYIYHESLCDTKSKIVEAIVDGNTLMDNLKKKDIEEIGYAICGMVELLKDVNLELTQFIN